MRSATFMSQKRCCRVQWDFFPSSISKGLLREINLNVCSFIFTEKKGIAQISNVHLFSRQLSSGQSFADLLLVSYSMPVLHRACLSRFTWRATPPSSGQGGRARSSHPDPLKSNGKFPPRRRQRRMQLASKGASERVYQSACLSRNHIDGCACREKGGGNILSCSFPFITLLIKAEKEK